MTKLPEQAKARPSVVQEMVEAEDFPVETDKLDADSVPPEKSRGLAMQIPPMPNFKLDHAEKERRDTDHRIANRKTKTELVSSIYTFCSCVGTAHLDYDNRWSRRIWPDPSAYQFSLSESFATANGIRLLGFTNYAKVSERRELHTGLRAKASFGAN